MQPSSPTSGWRAAVAVLCLVQFVDVLGVTMIIMALPTILDDLEASDAAEGRS